MVFAAIILFNPNKDILRRSIESIKNDISQLLLVDNSLNSKCLKDFFDNNIDDNIEIGYYHNGNKGGIAGAHNIAIRRFLGTRCDFLLMLDQDSIPYPDMLMKLKQSFLFYKNTFPIACIGPSEDIHNHVNSDIYRVAEIKSSGAFFCKNIFNIVGLMEEGLFIDTVDSEWCWRARKKGFFTFVVNNAKMIHTYGEGNRQILGFNIAMTVPFRTYYQIRNYIIMVKRGYVPLGWKIRNGIKYMVKFIVYPLLTKNKSYYKYMFKGLYHGIINRKGQLE